MFIAEKQRLLTEEVLGPYKAQLTQGGGQPHVVQEIKYQVQPSNQYNQSGQNVQWTTVTVLPDQQVYHTNQWQPTSSVQHVVQQPVAQRGAVGRGRGQSRGGAASASKAKAAPANKRNSAGGQNVSDLQQRLAQMEAQMQANSLEMSNLR